MTLKQATEYLASIGKPKSIASLKRAAMLGYLKVERREIPIAHYVTSAEWLDEWLQSKKVRDR